MILKKFLAAYVGLHQQSFYVVNAYKQLSTIDHCENDPDEINGLYDLIGWHPLKDQNDVPLLTDGDEGHCQIGKLTPSGKSVSFGGSTFFGKSKNFCLKNYYFRKSRIIMLKAKSKK